MTKIKTLLSVFALIFLATTIYIYSDNIKNVGNDVQDKIVVDAESLRCLAENIYFEARGESFEGQIATGQVVLNRLNDPRYPDTVCQVVHQKSSGVYQFSWVANKNKDITDVYAWTEATFIAEQMLQGNLVHTKLLEDKALFYHTEKVHPKWKKKYIVSQVGNHVFYKGI